jgi:hypothetical protein
MMQKNLGALFIRCWCRSKLILAVLEAFEGVVSKGVYWKHWLEMAWRHHLCIIDWPDDVPPPGPDFVFKAVKAEHLKALVCNYIRKIKNPSSDVAYPTIIRWSDGAKFPIFLFLI